MKKRKKMGERTKETMNARRKGNINNLKKEWRKRMQKKATYNEKEKKKKEREGE